ncbi:MAG TPA: aminoglycoside phosphotransferase family protein [Tepidiformaceae bacterium]|nr:aminoglycoside phosphotransferase family protein [Tepidiformaceae bacterium]
MGLEEGRAWIDGLASLVGELCDEWGLEPGVSDFSLSYNFVLAVQRGANPAVLKLGVPGADFLREITALEVYGGEGMCAVLEEDRPRAAMLLERIEPGTPLLHLGETPGAISAAVSVMRQLRKPAPPGSGLEPLSDWWRIAQATLRERSGGSTEPFPPDLVAAANEIYLELERETSRYVVLHGDLHHWNILASDRKGWLAIDPHGVLGPPECEVGAFMMNPNNGALVRPDVRQVLSRRLDQFAEELAFDREQLRRVSFAYAMLSAIWSSEDGGGGWKPTLDVARVLLTA